MRLSCHNSPAIENLFAFLEKPCFYSNNHMVLGNITSELDMHESKTSDNMCIQ